MEMTAAGRKRIVFATAAIARSEATMQSNLPLGRWIASLALAT
jgi:hypothetical protein